MPFLLYTYLISEILGPFFAALLIVNAILFLGKLSSLLDIIFGFGIGLADFARIGLYLLPNLLQFSIPMAATFGVIIAFTRLSGDNEILALKASGCGLSRLVWPVLLVALFAAGFTALDTWLLIPRSNLALKQTFFQLAREKIDRGLRSQEFSDSLDKVVIYVDQVDPASKDWQGVYISDRRDPANPLIILARSGRLTANAEELLISLELRNGTILRDQNEISQTIAFEDYRLRLPLNAGATGLDQSYNPKELGKKELYPSQLLARAAEFRREAARNSTLRRFYLGKSADLTAEFHNRFALPVGCLILALLALPLSLQTRPGRGRPGLALGLFFFVLYYILLSVAQALAETSGLPVALLLWSPNLIFALLTIALLYGAARENTMPFLERLLEWAAISGAFFGKLLGRRSAS
jgi:lipopolysaccharide export system permease protein